MKLRGLKVLTFARASAVTTAAPALDLEKGSLGEAGCELERRKENQKQEKGFVSRKRPRRRHAKRKSRKF